MQKVTWQFRQISMDNRQNSKGHPMMPSLRRCFPWRNRNKDIHGANKDEERRKANYKWKAEDSLFLELKIEYCWGVWPVKGITYVCTLPLR